jgi:predicted CXXCH cytochrome family protein
MLRRHRKLLLSLSVLVLGGGCLVFLFARNTERPRRKTPARAGSSLFRAQGPKQPLQLARGQNLTVWWDVLPDEYLRNSIPSGDDSNIHPSDYLGRPEACQSCHKKNYESWSQHPHRWMNALADPSTVRGDFSPGAAISYRGGRVTFTREGDDYFMCMQRGEIQRKYRITQTIGSRFFQYYVGRQIEGPEDKDHHFYSTDHVLPLGYWLAQKEWVPTIHIGPEVADDVRFDPFLPPDSGDHYAEYAASCNGCHTTFPLADMLGRRTKQMGEFAPVPMHWSMREFLQTAHPEMLDPATGMVQMESDGSNPMHHWEAPQYAATLGVSCEACHLGSRQHVQSAGRIPPRFAPSSPHLRIEAKQPPPTGRTHDNINWACGRCHVGPRPQFAAGMSTWNSVEYSDAMRGSCYSQLTCVDCHNPHQAIGERWSRTADADDAVCLKCHEQYRPEDKRVQHTHHPLGSDGARCFNCHMPRINEGIEDVVRTHTIFSPTRADMLEANHPNACNLCHTDKPIDWTLAALKDWYGKTYDEARIAANYPKRDKPVGLGWLDSKNESVRLVAVEAMTRRHDMWALPRLLDALDDPFLVNRQFAYKGLQEMLNVRLGDFGYRFYMMKEERQQPLAKLRARFAVSDASQKRPGLLDASAKRR